MSWTACLRFVLVLLLLVLPARPQVGAPLGRDGPHPPDWPQNQIPAEQVSLETRKRAPVDMAKLQHDAQELAEVSASIPADVNRANHGVLSKDLIDKLKRVEKLSKQLRGELTR